MPHWSYARAINCTDAPTVTVTGDGVSVTVVTTGCPTTCTFVCVNFPPDETVIVAVPGALNETVTELPKPEIDATDGFEDDQLYEGNWTGIPFWLTKGPEHDRMN